MIYLPENLPIADHLRNEKINVGMFPRHQHSNFLNIIGRRDVKRILFLNLMPQKQVTELDISRMIAHAENDVQLIPIKIHGQSYKTTPIEHMEAFYTDFEDVESEYFDGLIVTGAPLEQIEFESVRYWPQLCHIMAWARTHTNTTLYICWAAQAALYYHYHVCKQSLPSKKFGIFTQNILLPHPLLDDIQEGFAMPHSRHTEVNSDEIEKLKDKLKVIAVGKESGVGIAVGYEGREVYVTGHLEYEPYTLHKEYIRDLTKGLPIQPPKNYYTNDDPTEQIVFGWEEPAKKFYRNWIRMTNI